MVESRDKRILIEKDTSVAKGVEKLGPTGDEPNSAEAMRSNNVADDNGPAAQGSSSAAALEAQDSTCTAELGSCIVPEGPNPNTQTLRTEPSDRPSIFTEEASVGTGISAVAGPDISAVGHEISDARAEQERHRTAGTEQTENEDPFQRLDWPPSFYEICKIILMTVTLIMPLRIIICSCMLILYVVATRIAFIGVAKPKVYSRLFGWRKWLYDSSLMLTRVGMFICGVYRIRRFYVTPEQMRDMRGFGGSREQQLREEGRLPRGHSPDTIKMEDLAYVIVSNHCSIIDIFFLWYEFGPLSFLSKGSMEHAFIFGKIMSQLQCLFVSSRTKSLVVEELMARQRNYMRADASQPPRMVIFPEATTTNGKYLIGFHKGAFVAGMPVQPVAIRYPFRHFKPSYHRISYWHYVIRLNCQFVTFVDIIHFPVYRPTQHERRHPNTYAKNVQELMRRGINIFAKQYRDGIETKIRKREERKRVEKRKGEQAIEDKVRRKSRMGREEIQTTQKRFNREKHQLE